MSLPATAPAEEPRDTFYWSRKYEILSMSRLVLRDLGFSVEQINSLSDEDMQAIADGLQEQLSKAVGGLAPSLKFLVSLYIAEKEHDANTIVRCDVCLTWVATHDVTVENFVYHVCDKPRCQDKVAALQDTDNRTGGKP